MSIHFRPDDFTQVNFDINISMIEQVLGLLSSQPDENVSDLFCGLGKFFTTTGEVHRNSMRHRRIRKTGRKSEKQCLSK